MSQGFVPIYGVIEKTTVRPKKLVFKQLEVVSVSQSCTSCSISLSLSSLTAVNEEKMFLHPVRLRSLRQPNFLGFEEDILIASEGKMTPFTHD